MKISLLALSSMALFAGAATACTAGSTTPYSSGTPNDGVATPDEGPVADAGPAKPGKDAAPPETKPEEDPVPTSPMFEVKIDGTAIKVKNVSVERHILYPSDGTSYYEITATLDKAQPIVDGIDEDPTLVIRVGKDENGKDVCKEKRGPQVGFIQPVIELREVEIHYHRWTGSKTVSAYPSTKDSACTMQLKSAATNGQAWGEAAGTVQAGTGEPVISFETKWFQNVTWK
jgi:hypothetical protein